MNQDLSHVLFNVVPPVHPPPVDASHDTSLLDGYFATDEFMAIRIEDRLWQQRIQDEGCVKKDLPKRTYLSSNIPPIGPTETCLYYYHLSSIAIDFLKKMFVEKEMGRGWVKIPKNRTDVKLKIIERLLALRRRDDQGKYSLGQNRVLLLLSNTWGNASVSSEIHFNDRVRLCKVIMSLDENREYYQRLAEGCSSRKHLDDPEFSMKQIFQTLAFSFNNEKVIVEFPKDAWDLDGIEEIDPNDRSRIRISRDCK